MVPWSYKFEALLLFFSTLPKAAGAPIVLTHQHSNAHETITFSTL